MMPERDGCFRGWYEEGAAEDLDGNDDDDNDNDDNPSLSNGGRNDDIVVLSAIWVVAVEVWMMAEREGFLRGWKIEGAWADRLWVESSKGGGTTGC